MCASREGRGKPSQGRSRHPCPRVAPMRVTRHAWPRARIYFRVATSARLFSRGRMVPGCQDSQRRVVRIPAAVANCSHLQHARTRRGQKTIGLQRFAVMLHNSVKDSSAATAARSSTRHAPTRSAGVYTHTPTCHAPTRHACASARIMRGREQPMSPAHPRAPPKKSYIGDYTGLNPLNRSSPN